MIQSNVVEACRRTGVEKLMLLGSSCIYPRLAQPIPESALLTGPLEPTNQWYAVAKIAGIKLGQPIAGSMAAISSRSCRPTCTVPATISTSCKAMSCRRCWSRRMPPCAPPAAIEVWGTGAVRREFLYVDDAADGMVYLMQNYSDEAIVNLGPAPTCRSSISSA
jgi:GDP-L-fucose synthase